MNGIRRAFSDAPLRSRKLVHGAIICTFVSNQGNCTRQLPGVMELHLPENLFPSVTK